MSLESLVDDLLAIEDGIEAHLELDQDCKLEGCPAMVSLRTGWDAVLVKLRAARAADQESDA
jgi:hypothetical protein